jgi:hypothetical protein
MAFLLSLGTAPVWSAQLWYSTHDLPDTIPQAGRVALSQNITCSQLVTAIKVTGQVLYSKEDLIDLCTTNCAKSLQSFLQNIHEGCGDTVLDYGSGSTTGARLAEPLSWAYNVTCFQDA